MTDFMSNRYSTSSAKEPPPLRKGDRVRMREERSAKRRFRQGTVKTVRFFDYEDGDHDWLVTMLWDGRKSIDSQMARVLILVGENDDMRAELQRGDVEPT